ncbi:MAG TPA: beta-galactosidase [Verrucomicrobiae bacterium]|nr:beta-galactosidase [Verrucomicrobiae bacterium]
MTFIVAILTLSLLTTTFGAAPSSDNAGHRFRVAVTNGVPQLIMDGKPTRGRIFWGGPAGGGHASIGPDWSEIAFEFTAPETDGEAALHLRFGQDPGEVWFDDIRITELGAGAIILASDFEDGQEALWKDWQLWCKGRDKKPAFQGLVAPGEGHDGHAALRLKIGNDPKLDGLHLYRPHLKLAKDTRYRVTLWARASAPRQLTPTIHHQGGSFQKYGGLPPPYASEVKCAAARNVNIVSFPIPTLWAKPGGEPDTSGIESACRTTLEANPAALLLPRIGMYPPRWWLDSHPDAVMAYEGGKRGETASVSSPEYRRDSAAALRRTIRWCEDHYGPHMAGYHPCGQNTGEWFYYDSWEHPLNGLEPATLLAWRTWLARKYPTHATLSRAWSTPDAVPASATVPTPDERRAAPHGQLRDPSREMRCIDFAMFQQEEMADTVLCLARALREEAGPDRLSVFFYGYVFEFGTLPNSPAVSGHYALRRVLGSPDIDVLCAPISYYDRQAGGGAPCMTAAESVMLSGKLWLNEDDTRTHLAKGSRAPGWQAGADTQATSAELLRRNLAHETARNFATWWMDLGSSGWFDDPVLWEEMDRFREIEGYFLNHPTPFRPEIAAVLDERSMLLPVGSGPVPWTTRPLIYTVRENLHRVGAPFGQYLLDDILGKRTNAKLNIFLAAWWLSADERAELKKATRGSANIWCWAPGYFDSGRPSPESVADLTGFDVKVMGEGFKAHMKATADGLAIGLPATFGQPKPVAPLLSPRPRPGDSVLALFEDGSPAIVLRKGPEGISLLSAGTELPTPLVRHLARLAGVHLYCHGDANIFANGPLFAVHAPADGPIEIDLGRERAGRNVTTHERFTKRREFQMTLKKGQTQVLWLDD